MKMSAAGGRFYFLLKKGDKMRELREAFERADQDGNGSLSKQEWIDVMKECDVQFTE